MGAQQDVRRAPTSGAARALEVTGLTKTFGGIVALDNVDFVASPGEVHALLAVCRRERSAGLRDWGTAVEVECRARSRV